MVAVHNKRTGELEKFIVVNTQKVKRNKLTTEHAVTHARK